MLESGTLSDINLVDLHITVDDGDHFQQILAWTKTQLLREITGSVHSEKINRMLARAGRREPHQTVTEA